MKSWLIGLCVALAPAAARAADRAALFTSEAAALEAIAELGDVWRTQIAPPDTLPTSWLPMSRHRRFFFAGRRLVDLEWDRAGTLTKATVVEPDCWRTDLERTLAILARLTAADPGKLRLMAGAARMVFYRGFEPELRVLAGEHLIFAFHRTSARYSCQISMIVDARAR